MEEEKTEQPSGGSIIVPPRPKEITDEEIEDLALDIVNSFKDPQTGKSNFTLEQAREIVKKKIEDKRKKKR